MPLKGTKNLGLIKAIHNGVNPPLNKKMIWFNDSTLPYTTGAAKIHYYYDVITSDWRPLGGQGGGGLSIPTPILSVGKRQGSNEIPQQLLFHFMPGSDNTWLTMNPRLFLFSKRMKKYKKKIDINDVSVRHEYKGGFRHTVHQNGVNFPTGSFYRGSGSISYDTEFPITILQPYEKQIIGCNLLQFFYLYDVDTDTVIANPITTADIPADPALLRVSGRKGFTANSAKSSYFKFAIAIDNPNAESDMPVIFGEFSDIIQVTPLIQSGVIRSFNIKLVHNSLKRNTP